MESKRSWGQQIKIHPVRAVLIAFLAVVIVLIILSILGYIFNWDWTGLGPYVSPPHSTDSDFQRGKTLWDWLQILGVLAVPVVVGFGAVWFTTQQSKVADAENKDNQCETALQAYIDKMSELLLKEHLCDLPPEGELKLEYEEVKKIARVRTLTVLPRLDATRKRSVLQFLYESRLIDKNNSIIDLKAADLSAAILYVADQSRHSLWITDLRGADLSEANLCRADLRNAKLSYANLSATDLREANLDGANLSHANLDGADLSHANLDGADLTGAKVTEEQLKQAKSLKGATMPDGSKHP